MVETTLSRILIQNLSFLKLFLRVNLFVIISLYRVFLLRFGSEGMFQFLFHQQICLIHHFFSMVAPNQRSSIYNPFLIDVGQNGEFINQKWMFLYQNQRLQKIQWYQFGTNAVVATNKVSLKAFRAFKRAYVLLCCPSLEVPDCK